MAQKNKRLSGANQDSLVHFALQKVEATEDKTRLDELYDLAADAVQAAFNLRWPPKDMAVLNKYSVARRDECVMVADSQSGVTKFTFRSGDARIGYRADRYSCRQQVIPVDDQCFAAVVAHAEEAQRRAKNVDSRMAAFRAVIRGCSNFNALVEVWPAAEEMRSAIVGQGTALAVLDADAIARLAADPAFEGAA